MFQKLLQMVSGLEECIMSGSDEEVVDVAKHGCQPKLSAIQSNATHFHASFKKVCPALELMIPRD